LPILNVVASYAVGHVKMFHCWVKMRIMKPGYEMLFLPYSDNNQISHRSTFFAFPSVTQSPTYIRESWISEVTSQFKMHFLLSYCAKYT